MKRVLNKFRKMAIRITILLLIYAIVALGSKYINSNKKTIVDSSITTSKSETWSLFTSERGNFTILFPVPNPKLAIDDEIPLENSDLKRRLIQYAENDDRGDSYIVEVGVYPPSYILRNDSYNLNLYKNLIIRNYSNPTITDSSNGNFLGYPYLEFTLIKGEDEYYKYRIFSIEDRSYSIILGSRSPSFPLFDKFANSFKIIKFAYDNITWKPLISTDWNFKVIFPGDVVTSNQTIPNALVSKNVGYTSIPNKREYFSLLVNKYKDKFDLHERLNGTIKTLNDQFSLNYKIISTEDSTFQSNPSLTFLAETDDLRNVGFLKGKMISLGNTLYMIYGEVQNEKYIPNIDKIINSFELLK